MTEPLLERATQLVAQNRFKDAENSLREVLTQNPSNIEALSLMAVCHSGQDNHAEAIKLIRQAIAMEPDNDRLLYLHAVFSLRNDSFSESEKFIKNAIDFNPTQPEYFGLLASIKMQKKDWSSALELANKGLALDPDNLTCLNTRSTALFKLDKKDEAYSTIREALEQDPENDSTHANIGWSLLEQNDHKKALQHFSEALRLNPENAYAKAGLVEGLKARYWFYRIFLKYAFWVGNMKGKGQWMLIIGMYVGVRILTSVGESNPGWSFLINPIIYTYFIFALSTWLIEPLSNLFLRLNVYGRFALSQEEIKSSNFVGVFLVIGLLGGLMFLLTDISQFSLVLLYGLFMMIPLASMFKGSTPRNKKILIAYTVILGLIGLGAIIGEFTLIAENPLVMMFIWGTVIYQWVANALIIR